MFELLNKKDRLTFVTVDPFNNPHDEARRQSMVPFDPQLDPGTDPASSMNDSYATQTPMFEQTGEHYAVPSDLDPTTRDMLRHQLVAASARLSKRSVNS
jgi:hypothetical protein